MWGHNLHFSISSFWIFFLTAPNKFATNIFLVFRIYTSKLAHKSNSVSTLWWMEICGKFFLTLLLSSNNDKFIYAVLSIWCFSVAHDIVPYRAVRFYCETIVNEFNPMASRCMTSIQLLIFVLRYALRLSRFRCCPRREMILCIDISLVLSRHICMCIGVCVCVDLVRWLFERMKWWINWESANHAIYEGRVGVLYIYMDVVLVV